MGHVPIWLDPERGILFFIAASTSDIETWVLCALSLQSRQVKPLVEQAWGLYVLDHLIYMQRGRLMAAPFDTETLQITGPAANVTEDRMATDKTLPSYTVSPEGTLVYAPIAGLQESNRDLVWVDLDGHEEPVAVRPMMYNEVRVSGDINHPQVVAGEVGDLALWTYDPAGTSPIRPLTFSSDGKCYAFAWMPPTNREIIFYSFDATAWQLKRKAVDGRDQARLLSIDRSGWSGLWPQTSTPDGKVLLALATAEKPGSGIDIVAIHLQGNGRVEPLLTSDDNEVHAALSPDGKWLAYVSDEPGRYEVFVKSFPDLEGTWQISTEGGQAPVWAPDGAAIYYRDGTSLVKVPVKNEGGITLGRAEALFEDVYVSIATHRNYDIHPDGKRFLMIKRSQENVPTTELIVVENWSEELKRLVPTGKNQ